MYMCPFPMGMSYPQKEHRFTLTMEFSSQFANKLNPIILSI